MIFEIYDTERSNHPLIEKYPALSKYGYHDEVKDYWGNRGKVIINSPQELVSLSKDLGQEIIISTRCTDTPYIEIYDDWRE